MGKINMKITINNNNNLSTKKLLGIRNNDYIIFIDEYKTVINLNTFQIIRTKDNYKLELNLVENKKTISKIIINNKSLDLETFTNCIEIKNNLFKASYLIENNPINIKIEM